MIVGNFSFVNKEREIECLKNSWDSSAYLRGGNRVLRHLVSNGFICSAGDSQVLAAYNFDDFA